VTFCRCKEGQSPFTECSIPKSTTKTNGRYAEIDWAILRKNGELPLHKACQNKITGTRLPAFVASSRGQLQEEGGLPTAAQVMCFDPNVYKRMKRYGYDFSKPPVLGSVIKIRPYGLNDM